MSKITLDNAIVYHGSNLDILPTLPDNSVDSIVTDPPYELGFMGKKWDSSGIAYSVDLWTECLRVLKPGGHLLAFGGSRTWHRLAVAIEDAGFEMRDSIAWLYGSGFPKSLDISKAIDKAMGNDPKRIIKRWNNDEDYVWSETIEALNIYGIEKYLLDNGYSKSIEALLPNWQDYSTLIFASDEGAVVGLPEGWENNDYGGGNAKCDKCGKWFISGSPCICPKKEIASNATPEAQKWQGWGTALKPAFEPVVVARKPLGEKTVAANVLAYGTGGLNIDASRIGTDSITINTFDNGAKPFGNAVGEPYTSKQVSGRWPANIILDPYTAELLDEQADASRFFYVAKASKKDRNEGLEELEARRASALGYDKGLGDAGEGMFKDRNSQKQNFHPTVKPTALMEYLIKLVTPEGGTVLDPFTGSGSTGKAALLNGYKFIGIELTDEYLPIIEGRLKWANEQQVNTASTTLF